MTHNIINNSDFQHFLSPFIGKVMKELLFKKKKRSLHAQLCGSGFNYSKWYELQVSLDAAYYDDQ